MKHTLRAALAVALLVGFYVLAIGLAFGVVALVIEAGVLGVAAGVLVKFFIIAVVAAFAILRGLFLRRRDHQTEPEGMAVTPEQQPVLWAEVRTLAADVGTRAPDEIRLVADVNAAVSEDARLLGLVPGTRRLYVGVPLLLGMSKDQVRSVLAHELGHYSGKDTALAPITYRGKEAIARVLGELGSNSFLGVLLLQYGKLYYAVAHSVGRRQELEADAFSARLVGGPTAASALREIPALGAAWGHFASSYARLGEKYSQRPADLFVGFSALLADPSSQEQLAKLRDELPEPEPSVYDTHPPLAHRVAALEALAVTPARTEAGVGLDLLVDQRATLARFEEDLFEGSGRDAVRWEFLVARAGAEEVAEARSALAATGERLGLGPVSAAGVLTRLEAPAPLGLSEEATEEEQREYVANLVGDVAADALIRREAAAFRPSWSGNVARLASTAGVEVDPWGLAREAAASGSVEPFRAWARTQGVDLDDVLEAPARPEAEDAPADAAEDATLGVVGPVSYQRKTRALVITRSGILVSPVPFGRLMAFGFRAQIGGAGARLADKFARDPIAVLRRHPKALLLPWSEIAALKVVDRRFRSSLVSVTMANGAEAVFKCGAHSANVGEPWAGMRAYLGRRLVVGD